MPSYQYNAKKYRPKPRARAPRPLVEPLSVDTNLAIANGRTLLAALWPSTLGTEREDAWHNAEALLDDVAAQLNNPAAAARMREFNLVLPRVVGTDLRTKRTAG
jgi:hypothetical protein